jgi:tetratricopeptide (TPR) repeat protein
MSVQTLSPKNELKRIQQSLQQSKFGDAEQSAVALLNRKIDVEARTQCWYLLAVCRRLQSQHESAIEAAQQLLKINTEHARAHQELGYNYRTLQKGKLASIHFYKATKLNPALLSAWQALLPIYQQADQQEALVLCTNQITHLSGLPKSLLAATDLLYEGNIVEADELCRRYLQENKHSLDGLMLLAEIAVSSKAISEAEFILETCIQLAPTNLEAHYQLFKIYSKLGKFAKALALGDILVQQDSNNIFYRVAKATALVGVGDIQKAIDIYQQIVEDNKAESNVYLFLGHAYKTQGNIEQSVIAYQQAYKLERHCGDAYWSLANTKTYQFNPKEIQHMLTGTTSNDVSLKDKVHLHFALGKAYEDEKQYKHSFLHYDLGNKLQSTTLTYSSDNHAQFVKSQISAFTPELVTKFAKIGHPDPAPLFIVGMPRAGSTLLEQILASHSKIDGTMELHEILGLASNLSKKQGNKPVYPHNIDSIPESYFAQLGQKFIQDTQVYRQGGAYFIDKMPNNYMHIGLIKLILPNAKIIDARREPMACCFSGFKQLFGEGQEFSYSLSDLAQYYKNYVKLMDHWQHVFPNQILQVQHEDVVNDTETQIRRLLDFCGLPFEQACLDFHKNKRAVKTPSAQQVRQPIYRSGLEQWTHFEPYLGELADSFID